MSLATYSTLVKMLESGDLRTQALWQREMFYRHAPKIHLIRHDHHRTRIDPLYRDSMDPVPKDPVELHAFVLPSPEKQKLKRYGFDTPRDLVVVFSIPILSDLGFIEDREDFLIGDWVKFDSDIYVIDEQKRSESAYWGGTNVPFQIACACSRYRLGR